MKNHIILLVDDEIESIQTVISCFEKQDAPYDFIMAKDGEMALSIISKNKPDIIIVDWDMPGLSGVELTKQVKQQEEYRQIPVIMLTGKMTDINHLQTALEAGAIDYVKKPFHDIELFSRVQAALRFAEITKEKHAKEQDLKDKEKAILELKAKHLEENIAQQKKELLTNAMQIHQLAKLQQANLVLINKLKTHIKREGMPLLKEIVNNYKITQNQINWELMEKKFDEAFKDFDKRLLTKHPSLSPGERRLAAFLRLNITSKDIAFITFQKESSINQARHRLRKKLQISTDENLVNFLSIL